MKNKKIPLMISLVMIAIAVIFFIYALSNPQASFGWSNTVTYAIYAVYGLVTVALLAIGIKRR